MQRHPFIPLFHAGVKNFVLAQDSVSLNLNKRDFLHFRKLKQNVSQIFQTNLFPCLFQYNRKNQNLKNNDLLPDFSLIENIYRSRYNNIFAKYIFGRRRKPS